MNMKLIFVVIFLLSSGLVSQAQQTNPQDRLSLSLPGKTWAVEVHAQGFVLDSEDLKSDKFRRIQAKNQTSGIVISVQLEKVPHQATLDECRQFEQERVKSFSSKFQLEDVKTWDDGTMAFTEYLIPKANDIPIRQKNLFACLAKEDVFADIHISKVSFEPEDELKLSAVMGTVYVADKPAESAGAATPNSMELFREGTRLYNQRKLREAIEPYQKALDLEKRERRLEANMWRVLVDNLGMAYGITGDLKKSKEVFEYGISQDKIYPMFYYNLACVFAEMNDRENAMANLKAAFEYRQNVIAGESMPDPRKDDSFQRFMKDERFRNLADSLVDSSK